MRAKWGSKIGFILATAGSAIGLGNIWRFPYLVGRYGGGVFLLTYLICVVVLGYFLLLAKLAFGRSAQTNVVDGFQVVGNRLKIRVSPVWSYLSGGLVSLNTLLVMSIYVIVIGWTASYVVEGGALWLGLSHQVIDSALFERLTSSFGRQWCWSVVCIGMTCLIIVKGVKKGIERVSLFLMPILFFLLLFMVLWMIFLPGSEQGILFFLKPNWERIGFTDSGFQIGPFCDLILTALGQAIYSLSMGMGVVYIYGSYLPKGTDIKASTKWIVGLDTLVAFLAGMIVLPAVFAFGLEPGQGPALSFISLPLIFSKMAAGHFLMFLFFLLLFLAAITSIISVYEPMVSLLIDKLSVSRIKAVTMVAGVNIIASTLVLMSFTNVYPMTVGHRNLFDFFDWISGSYSMAILVFVFCLFMGWKIYPVIMHEIVHGSGHQSNLFKWYLKWVLRVLTPLLMIVLFIVAMI